MTTVDLTLPRPSWIRALATRALHALGVRGSRGGRTLGRDELEQHILIQHEARRAVEARGDAHHGLYQFQR
jgi:hypothetical protein